MLYIQVTDGRRSEDSEHRSRVTAGTWQPGLEPLPQTFALRAFTSGLPAAELNWVASVRLGGACDPRCSAAMLASGQMSPGAAKTQRNCMGLKITAGIHSWGKIMN